MHLLIQLTSSVVCAGAELTAPNIRDAEIIAKVMVLNFMLFLFGKVARPNLAFQNGI